MPDFIQGRPEDDGRFLPRSPDPLRLGGHSLFHPVPVVGTDVPGVIVLSGIVIIDLQANSTNEWRRFSRDGEGPVGLILSLENALLDAQQDGLLSDPGDGKIRAFRIQRVVPFATISSVHDRHYAVELGFAVDEVRWRPLPPPFPDNTTRTVAIEADLAVRDVDATIHRIGYHVTVRGFARIVPGR